MKAQPIKTRHWLLFTFTLLLAGFSLAFLYSRSWKNSFFTDPLYQLSQNEKIVALTFDDGPNPSRTPPLLDLLEKHDVKATFFMLGRQIEQQPELARKVLQKGHLIGNHTYDHPYLVFKSPALVRRQLEKTDSLIQSIGQTEVRYFRPPYSAKFLVLPWILEDMDKVLVTGTYDPPAEYQSPYPAELVAEQVIANVEPGAIIYLHDGKQADAEAFVHSVERMIVALREAGYRFVRLDGE
ncbi:MAG: polysaccharide deacetylase family protein [Bacteroidota bacterium]